MTIINKRGTDENNNSQCKSSEQSLNNSNIN